MSNISGLRRYLAAAPEGGDGNRMGNKRWTQATGLTLLRAALVPVFLALVLWGSLLPALLVFLVAGATDLLDGLIARRFDQRSNLGQVLDPMADKLLLMTSFVTLTLPLASLAVRKPLWLTLTALGRDLFLLTAGLLALTRRRGEAGIVAEFLASEEVKNFSPSVWGKLTTALQLLTVLAVLVGNIRPDAQVFLPPIFLATLALTLISGLHYLARGIQSLASAESLPEE